MILFHLSISHVREQVTDRVDKINIDSLLKHRLVLVNLVKEFIQLTDF